MKYENKQFRFPPDQRLFLLGLVHGHFDVEDKDKVVDEAAKIEGPINTGVGIVTPARFIIELLNSDDLSNWRDEAIVAKAAPKTGDNG